MGVPKFFRWLSERYPPISQLIAENRIPEFDCLYLDMNGIIHNCTHKDAGEDTTFRLSEEEMFIRIFNYIEHLFGKIKPKQLFFMAIDGVAPRAKMNQQRARRFRTALDNEKAREKAIKDGVEMPKEEPFDSNCITPGTEFMAKLSLQLRYFVNKKVSEDSDWQGCEVVLSGHEVPGEGEHKIMEYIRNAKAQPNYNANVRHCLYGLDADLIMLGLLSHDPHFCLLREEVTFGRASKAKSKELEHQNFYLLHLCMVREYLEMEFQELEKQGSLTFPFNLERVIDDFILMAFFVGNDFLPNLPGLHINEGALANMFVTYKKVLPTCDGYINENGVINMTRLQRLLDELSKLELVSFKNDVADEKWFAAKQMEKKLEGRNGAATKSSKNGQLVITSSQRELWKQKIRPYVSKRSNEPLNLGAALKAADRKFVQDLADAMHLDWSTKEDENADRHLILAFPARPEGDDDEEEEEGNLAAYRVMKTYDKAVVVDMTAEDAQKQYEEVYQQKYQGWKTKYYLQKFPEWPAEKYQDEQKALCENYVQGLQWVLFYYYRGIASWPWFYGYHYAPLISDVTKGLGADLNFKKGQPFKPYEQLMGVLPDRSKKIVPKIYHDLMTNPSSPIIDFYPRDFELDMNGKKMDWEAVVKIPFIDEKRLLDAMAPKNDLLEDDEKARNGFGVPIKFTYSSDVNFTYPSSLPGIFPEIQNCRCIENIFDLPDVEGLEYLSGLTAGALLNVSALAGFPTLHTLPYTAQLVEGYGVNVFQSESKNPSVVVTLTDTKMRTSVEAWKAKLGQKCYVGYPFLQEAKVMTVQDELFSYELAEDGKQIITKDHSNREASDFAREAEYIEGWYGKRLGVTIGQVECLVYVHMLKGLIKTDEGALIKEYAENPSLRSIYASQTIVDEVVNEDERFIEKAALPIEEEFPIGTRAFFLGEFAYGRPLEITGHVNGKTEVVVSLPKTKEPDFAKSMIHQAERNNPYTPSFAVAKQLGVHPLVLSKITSSYQILNSAGLKLNLGLNLKFEGRKLKVLGYSRKSRTGWEFSSSAIKLIADYMVAFPDFWVAIQREPQKSEISDTDLWKDPSVASQRVKDIVAWLKKQETSKFERVPLEAEQLDSDVVMALAEAGERVFQATQDIDIRKMKGVPRAAILKPSDAELVLGNQSFQLGDRVTFAAAAGKVPIATRGTVVGISRTATALLLDVLWDTSFMSGTTLGDRAPMFRGQTVASSSVLNTSDKQVVSTSSRSQQRRAAPNQTTGTYGSIGITQLKDAPTPPPLRGGWRGAMNPDRNSQARRGSPNPRGGAAPNLLHSSLVYRGGPNGTAPPGQGSNGQGRGGNQNGRGGGSARGRGRGNFEGAQAPSTPEVVEGVAAAVVEGGTDPPEAEAGMGEVAVSLRRNNVSADCRGDVILQAMHDNDEYVP
ncbi:exonuclease [Purpureocillium lavendulum]|uniref:5'-3' exoribonuclease 1 n=1 Tax=Purpureocillium lavendulum TaxID=1247861 RepID=A0AB34FIJ2_9HYPO|nr:exonuclease [Purpureocillium lavendulum]